MSQQGKKIPPTWKYKLCKLISRKQFVFPTEGEALAAAEEWNITGGIFGDWKPSAMEAYYCNCCHGYHLTRRLSSY